MSDNLLEIDMAMNMIKEDVIRELSESVSKQKDETCYPDSSSSNMLSFADQRKD